MRAVLGIPQFGVRMIDLCLFPENQLVRIRTWRDSRSCGVRHVNSAYAGLRGAAGGAFQNAIYAGVVTLIPTIDKGRRTVAESLLPATHTI